MNDRVLTITENVLAVCGTAISLALIEQILGIVLLVIQVLLIAFRVGAKVVSHIKNGKVDQAIDEATKGKEEIDRLVEDLKRHGKEG